MFDWLREMSLWILVLWFGELVAAVTVLYFGVEPNLKRMSEKDRWEILSFFAVVMVALAMKVIVFPGKLPIDMETE